MEDPRLQLTPHLLPGEPLLWAGRPDPARHFTPQDGYLVPFSVVWCGFAIFWLSTALAQGAPVPFALFGVPFVAVGLYLVGGRFVVKARRKRRTVYGLTPARAIVAVGPGSVRSAPVQAVPVERRRSRDGRHLTVTFGAGTRGWTSGPSYANTGMEFFGRGGDPLGFHDVADVSGLENALRGARL